MLPENNSRKYEWLENTMPCVNQFYKQLLMINNWCLAEKMHIHHSSFHVYIL